MLTGREEQTAKDTLVALYSQSQVPLHPSRAFTVQPLQVDACTSEHLRILGLHPQLCEDETLCINFLSLLDRDIPDTSLAQCCSILTTYWDYFHARVSADPLRG